MCIQSLLCRPTRISAGVGDHPCFFTFHNNMIPINCKITELSHTVVCCAAQENRVHANRVSVLTEQQTCNFHKSVAL